MVNFIFLTTDFYNDYKHCTEIEQKENRPYAMVLATINNIDFAIPLRSNINHKHVVWTDEPNKCGLDLSKTIVISDKKHIEITKVPYIRQIEFDALRGKEHFIKQRLESYIRHYMKALGKQQYAEKALLCKYSTLQYFHNELGIV